MMGRGADRSEHDCGPSSSRDRVAAEPALAELVDRLTARLQAR